MTNSDIQALFENCVDVYEAIDHILSMDSSRNYDDLLNWYDSI